MKKIILIVIVLILVVRGIELFYKTNSNIKNNTESTLVIDSLKNELDIQIRINERYEIAIDRFKEQNPKASEELEECFHNIE